ncbi:hypothetical protein FOL47_001001 [Perkinsus chesapeaki]|uniref:V-SNARE coiled-coil homology domain-containing protein n=1 Tax=Perkinsus chesapeaki TaxID=330153 RepID=A0A7J6KVM8_PERCH|nr:hypothetical protein FOL47_001001 [Perkinsus chesapeaki]
MSMPEMRQPPLVYACIAKGTYVVCEYQPVFAERDPFAPGNRSSLEDIIFTARKDMTEFSRIEKQSHTLVYRSHTINFFREDPYIYVVVAHETEGGVELPSMVLQRMVSGTTRKYNAASSVVAMTRELKEIIVRISRMGDRPSLMDAGNGTSMTKVSQVEDELDAVADIMVENINAVINRGESIASLMDKTSNLGVDARAFRSKAKQVVRKIWWQRAKAHGLLVAIILVSTVGPGVIMDAVYIAGSSEVNHSL